MKYAHLDYTLVLVVKDLFLNLHLSKYLQDFLYFSFRFEQFMEILLNLYINL